MIFALEATLFLLFPLRAALIEWLFDDFTFL